MTYYLLSSIYRNPLRVYSASSSLCQSETGERRTFLLVSLSVWVCEPVPVAEYRWKFVSSSSLFSSLTLYSICQSQVSSYRDFALGYGLRISPEKSTPPFPVAFTHSLAPDQSIITHYYRGDVLSIFIFGTLFSISNSFYLFFAILFSYFCLPVHMFL